MTGEGVDGLNDPFAGLRADLESGACVVWCPCWGTPEPDGSWVAPDDFHADVHVLDWLFERKRGQW